MLTEKAITEFYISRSGLKPKSQRWYRFRLTRFAAVFTKLPDQPQPIQAWLSTIQGTPETVDAYYRAIRALYHQTCLWNRKVKNPMPRVKRPRVYPKAMRTFSYDELYALFNRCLLPRDRALFTFLLDTGARADECASLTWENVAPDHAIVTGKSGERVVPLSPTTYRLLLALKEHSQGAHVFIGKKGPLSYEGIYKAVRKGCRLAGITGSRSSPHSFRHTFGTAYAENPACNPEELQKIMGHRDFKTTLKYIHGTQKSMIENHRICTPLRGVEALAQGRLFEDEVLKEAEKILDGMDDQ